MPSVRMELWAINLTKKLKSLANLTGRPVFLVSKSRLSVSPGVSADYLLTIQPHGALFFDTTFHLFSFLSSETEQD